MTTADIRIFLEQIRPMDGFLMQASVEAIESLLFLLSASTDPLQIPNIKYSPVAGPFPIDIPEEPMPSEPNSNPDLIALAKLVQEMRRLQVSFFAGNKADLAHAKVLEKMLDRRVAEILDGQGRLF